MLELILLLVDGSEASRKAAEVTIPLAKQLGSRIIALNIVNTIVAQRLKDIGGKSESEILVELEESGWSYLYSIEELAKDQGAMIVLQQEEGFPEAKIIESARKWKVNLVVIANKMGKTEELQNTAKIVGQLLKHLSCPVMVI